MTGILLPPGFLPIYPLAVGLGLLVAYLLGAIPVGLIVGRLVGGIDIREHGSGNPGFTNVARTLGWGPGIVTFVLDMLKGALGGLLMLGLLFIARDLMIDDVLIAYEAGDNLGVTLVPAPEFYYRMLSEGLLHDIPCALALMAPVLGHMFSPFMGFKGGKGISTGFGGLLVLMPTTALFVLVVFLVFALVSRIISVGSIAAAVSLPLGTAWLYPHSTTYLLLCTLTALIIIYAHRKNVSRLLKGDEPRFSVGRKKGER